MYLYTKVKCWKHVVAHLYSKTCNFKAITVSSKNN